MPTSTFVQKLLSRGHLDRPGTRPFPHVPGLRVDKSKLGSKLEELAELTAEALADGKLSAFELISIGQALASLLVKSGDRVQGPVVTHTQVVTVQQGVTQVTEAAVEALQTLEGAQHPVVDQVNQVEQEVRDLAMVASPGEAIQEAIEVAREVTETVQVVEEQSGPVGEVIAKVADAAEGVADAIKDILDGSKAEAPTESKPTPRNKRSRRQ